MIGFSMSDEQAALRDHARDFATREIRPVAEHYDRTAEYPWEVLRKAHEVGLMNTHIPERFGGLGLRRRRLRRCGRLGRRGRLQQIVGSGARRAGEVAQPGQQARLLDRDVSVARLLARRLLQCRQGFLVRSLGDQHLGDGERRGGRVFRGLGSFRGTQGEARGEPHDQGQREDGGEAECVQLHSGEDTSLNQSFTSREAAPIICHLPVSEIKPTG